MILQQKIQLHNFFYFITFISSREQRHLTCCITSMAINPDPFSEKGTLLKETLQAIPITYRDGAPEDLVISECLSRIYDVIKKINRWC